MSLRDRREPLDALEVLIRQSLRERAAGKAPSPLRRREVLQRAAHQRRHLAWRLPRLFVGLFGERPSWFVYADDQYTPVYLESLFGPRLGWFSFNQLVR